MTSTPPPPVPDPPASDTEAGANSGSGRPGWLAPPVIAAALLSMASGIGQFSVTAGAGDVAEAFGQQTTGDTIADQIGLAATTLSLALAIIRGASIFALPATAIADRFGRRRVIVQTAFVGLVATVLAAGAPTFWTYVLLVAIARPFLSTVNAVTGVVGAEETGPRDRSMAIAFVGASYGLGAGLITVLRFVLPGDTSFRVTTGVAIVPLLLLPVLARHLEDPPIYRKAEQASETPGATNLRHYLPGAVPTAQVAPLVLLSLVAGAIAVVTGPGFTNLFVFGESILGASEGAMTLLVVAAGPVGLVGLLIGRWSADNLGRRVTAIVTMMLTSAAIALMYSGSFVGLAIGYLAGVSSSGAFAPAYGALVAETFPTATRSTATAWAGAAGVVGAVAGLLLFGVLADRFDSFSGAAVAIAVPVGVSALLLVRAGETMGSELPD